MAINRVMLLPLWPLLPDDDKNDDDDDDDDDLDRDDDDDDRIDIPTRRAASVEEPTMTLPLSGLRRRRGR